MKRRAVVEVLTALKEPSAKPTVWIETNTAGRILYGVRTTGASLRKVRAAAEEAFDALKAKYGNGA